MCVALEAVVLVDGGTPSRYERAAKEHAGRARVMLEVSMGAVVAWVSSRDYRARPKKKSAEQSAEAKLFSGVSNRGMLNLLGSVSTYSHPPLANPIACTGATRILAVRDGRRVVVGSIDPLAPFSAGAVDGVTAPLTGAGSLLAAPETTLVVPTRDLVPCSPSTTAEAVDEPPHDDLSGFGADALGAPPQRALGLGSHPSVARIRPGAVSINGRLAPEVIQRVVRQNFAQMRLCYEQGVKGNPALHGRVAIRFVVNRNGTVPIAGDGGSDLPDGAVVSCIVHTFTKLVFPKPEGGGMVTVVYPFMFSYGD